MTIKFGELLKIAKEHLKELPTAPNPDFRLEQAEFNTNENSWDIVVSYLVENTNKRKLLATLAEFEYFRIYKKLRINENGEITGFFIFKE